MIVSTRRSFLAVASIAAFATQRARANRAVNPGALLLSCGGAIGTPEPKRIESDISFELAYLDTTIPYHSNALWLTEAIREDLDDERVITIADLILERHPQNLEELAGLRETLFGDRQTEEPTHEKMLIAMGGMESCTDESHMNYLDSEWVEETFSGHDDPVFAYVSMMVLLLEMEMHQHKSGVALAENHELHHFCERQVEEQTSYIEVLREVRGELFTRY